MSPYPSISINALGLHLRVVTLSEILCNSLVLSYELCLLQGLVALKRLFQEVHSLDISLCFLPQYSCPCCSCDVGAYMTLLAAA